jgi:hypothetical protein
MWLCITGWGGTHDPHRILHLVRVHGHRLRAHRAVAYPLGAEEGVAAMKNLPDRNSVTVSPSEIEVMFPRCEAASYLSPDEARQWADLLNKAAEAADLLGSSGVVQ